MTKLELLKLYYGFNGEDTIEHLLERNNKVKVSFYQDADYFYNPSSLQVSGTVEDVTTFLKDLLEERLNSSYFKETYLLNLGDERFILKSLSDDFLKQVGYEYYSTNIYGAMGRDNLLKEVKSFIEQGLISLDTYKKEYDDVRDYATYSRDEPHLRALLAEASMSDLDAFKEKIYSSFDYKFIHTLFETMISTFYSNNVFYTIIDALFKTYPLERIVDNYYRNMTKLNDTIISVRLF